MAPKTVNHGHAIYLEFRDKEDQSVISQLLFTGLGNIGQKVVPAKLYARVISPASPQTSWRKETAVSKDDSEPAFNLAGGFSRSQRPEYALGFAEQLYSQVALTADIMSVDASAWEPFGFFVVQVSPLDYVDIDSAPSPKKLLDRVRNVRTKLGWPELPSAAGKGTV